MKPPNFQYPPRIRNTVSSVAWFVLLISLIGYLWTWARVVYGWLLLLPDLGLPETLPMPFFTVMRYNPSWLLLTAHLNLLVALLVARAVAFCSPRIVMGNTGLWLNSSFGRRPVPFKAIRGVRSVQLQPSERYVVWVDTPKGAPWQGLIGSLLFGRWLWRGFLLTSDLSGFDEVIGRIIAELQTRYGEEKFKQHFNEEQPSALLLLLLLPLATVQKVITTEPLPLDMKTATRQMIFASLAFAPPLLVAALINLSIPWGMVFVPLMALIEWPLAAVYLLAIGDGFARKITFDEAMRIYPITQVSRWAFAVVAVLFIASGLPAGLIWLVNLSAIGAGSYLVMKAFEGWFGAQFPNSALGIVVTVIYQFLLYGVFYVFLTR
jgi:hypothetical protein